ncbi:MAG: 7-cyano-7-deazaguanine synthase QueC [Candidatus Kariarchaeaceae archaeon]|jgi:7-cyano-7-deazaguanine synthase
MTVEVENAVAIISGGLDSSTMLWDLHAKGIKITEALSFDYGQRHKKELDHVKKIVKRFSEQYYELGHRIVDVSSINELIAKGSLTGGEDVPKEMYDTKTQRVTIVPNRNMIFISIAAGRAVTVGASHVAYAAHASDHEVYPDCRPEFIEALDKALYQGNLWDPVYLYAPFQQMTKGDVVRRGIEIGVPFELSWSCYEGRERPCLECGTCLERTESFMQNDTRDPALTEDEWSEALAKYQAHTTEVPQ